MDEFASAMADRSMPAHRIQHLSNVAVDYQHGIFAGTNGIVEKLTGRAPLSVGQFVTSADFESSGPLFVP